MNGEAFFISLIAIVVVSGVLYAILKFGAKVGTFLIPLLCAIAIGVIMQKSGRGGGFNAIFQLLISSFVAIIGILGTLFCAVYAELFDLSKAVKVLSKTKEDISSDN